jgi:sulfate permease, SulP family
MTRTAPRLPAPRWLRQYDGLAFRADLVAGGTVAVMLIPQGMAYAALAGMPPVAGLYASIVPLLAYALLGTSGQLAVGPVAIVSLLTASALAPLADGDPTTYVTLAATLALLVGAILLLMGLLRLGALVNFLSHSVISGFTSAAAIVIAASQLGSLLGIDTERSESLIGTVAGIVAAAGTAHPATMAIAGVSIAALLLGKRLNPKIPMALLVVIAATSVAALLDLADAGVAVLREVPAGLPTPNLPAVTAEHLLALLAPAVTIALISYLEGISVAKAIAAKTRESIDGNAELIATGAANIGAGLFQAFPVAGGFSRTAVNHQAGARTPLAGGVTAVIVAATVAFLTPLLYHLPSAVLAAVIVVAVIGLIDVPAARHAWKVKRADALTLGATFVATLVLGVEIGILLGVAVSLALFVWRTANPHTAELGRVAGTGVLRNVDRYPAHTDAAVAVLRVDGPLYFANAKFVHDRLTALPPERPQLRAIVLDCSAVTDLDTSGEHTLRELDRELGEAGVELHLTTVRGPVRDVLHRAGLWEEIGTARVHPDVHTALDALAVPDTSPLRRLSADEQAVGQVY